MSSKFMRTKRIVVPVMAAIIFVSQLIGCAAVSSNEMVEMINNGESIVIEVNEPTSYEILEEVGESNDDVTWVQLDQLKTFNMGFRQGFDEILNINTISDPSQGTIGGKQGCIYIVNVGGKEMRSGNTTLDDAFRNKTFIEKYFSNEENQNKLIELCEDAYEDVDRNSPYALEATINAYFNLINNNENPDSFNPTQSMTREEFYTLLFKATNGVRELNYNESNDDFAKSVGGNTEYTKYAKEVAEYGFLDTENGSLDENSIGNSISRVEAIYMIVQQAFPDLYSKVTDSDKAFNDTKSAGDLALKAGFKEEVTKERENAETGETESYKEVVEKDKWQAYTLALMLKNPDKGMQSELYRAMVVAKQIGLISEDESRWDEVLSRSEAIDLVISASMAKNDIYGYLTTGEYADIEESESTVSGNDDKYETSTPNIPTGSINSMYTLEDLTDEQIAIFRQVVDESGAVELINEGLMTVEDMDREQNYMIDIYISTNVLPENGKELFKEWKEGEGYYGQFSGSTSGTSGTTGTVENGGSTGGTMGGSTAGNSSESTEEVIEVVPPTNTNKPDPSEGQKAEQDEANGEEEGLFEGLTWENKAEREQALNDLMDSASGGQPQGGVTLDPDLLDW